MSSNAEKATENYLDLKRWSEGKNLEDLISYLQRRKNSKKQVIEHKLNRRRIGLEVGIGTNAPNQNPDCFRLLADLDAKLLSAGLRDADVPVKSPEEEQGESEVIIRPVALGTLSSSEKQRLSDLEEENAYLREELKKKDAALQHYGLIDRFIGETMRVPR